MNAQRVIVRNLEVVVFKSVEEAVNVLGGTIVSRPKPTDNPLREIGNYLNESVFTGMFDIETFVLKQFPEGWRYVKA